MLGHHRRVDDGPFIVVVFRHSSLPSSTKKESELNSELDTLWQNFLDLRMGSYVCTFRVSVHL